jgi:15-cis-phytoene synthase
MTTSPQTRTPPVSEALAVAYEAARVGLRTLDPDRYLATLFAPKAAQPHLFALYAFSAEVARARESVSEPMLGEIRHQWWREALSCRTESTGDNPLALALHNTLKQFALPPEPLLALIEARSFDLYDDPMPTWLDLEGYCGETSSSLIRLATLILGSGKECGGAELCGHAGVAYAITGLLRAFPIHARRRQCYIPHEVLIACGVSHDDIFAGKDSDNLRAALSAMRKRAHEHLDHISGKLCCMPGTCRSAFFPVCLTRHYLSQMERADYNPFTTRIDLSPLRKMWIIGKSALRAR